MDIASSSSTPSYSPRQGVAGESDAVKSSSSQVVMRDTSAEFKLTCFQSRHSYLFLLDQE